MDFVSKVRKNRRDCNPPVLLQFFRYYICVLATIERMVFLFPTYNSRHYIFVLDPYIVTVHNIIISKRIYVCNCDHNLKHMTPLAKNALLT